MLKKIYSVGLILTALIVFTVPLANALSEAQNVSNINIATFSK